jgi:hypothetical protein
METLRVRQIRPTFTEPQIRIGASLGIAHVAIALIAHFAVPGPLETRLGLVADPWFRRETGTVNAGFAYGLVRVAQGHRDATFVRTTAISGLLMAGVRTVATLRGRRRGPLSALVIGSDLLLGLGGLALASQFDSESQTASHEAPLGARAVVRANRNQSLDVANQPKAKSR